MSRAQARGTGVAAALIADAEARLAERGYQTAWLRLRRDRRRASRTILRKCGWRRAGTFVSELETTAGIIPLEVWRYEKPLRI